MSNKASSIDIKELSQYIKNKKLIKVKGLYISKNLETNEKELIVSGNGLKGRIKSKDIEIQDEVNKRIHNYIGEIFYITINLIDDDKIYCSRKEAQIEILKNKIKVGDKLQAKLCKIYDYGALITLYDEMITTFVKNDDLLEKGIKISEIYREGQSISVVVKQVNNNKVLVEGTKKYNGDRNEYLSNIEEGEIVSGYITNSQVDKTFVRIAPGIDVLCIVEDEYSTNDIVDTEITKVDIENNSLRGKIINLKKIDEYISRLNIGKIVSGTVKKIIGNEYYVRINTCVYVKCNLSENPKVSIGDNIKVKLSKIDMQTKQIDGLYIDIKKLNERLENINEGDKVGGIIKSKTDSIYEVIINTGLRVTCKNINNSFNIDDHVFIEINSINKNIATVRGIILDTDKIEEYLKRRSIGEEQHGSITKISDNVCTVKAGVGVDIICPIPKSKKINKGNVVKVKLTEIDIDLMLLHGEIIENELENFNDYSRPFVLYGFDKPEMMNANRKFNKNALESMIKNGRISERDKCIVRFLMDCRFASFNQIVRFLSTNSEINVGTNLRDRVKKLIEYRVINGFRLKDGQMMIYCMDVGGKQILDKEQNEKSKDWTPRNVDKGWNIIGKALISTEIYVRAKEKYLDTNIEFNASPCIHQDINSKDTKQVVFSIKFKNKSHKLSILGEVYRADDVDHAFDKRIGHIEEYLANNLWKDEFKEYGRPKIIIVVESEERLLWVTNKLSLSYPNVMKDYIITTDSRLDEDIFKFLFV